MIERDALKAWLQAHASAAREQEGENGPQGKACRVALAYLESPEETPRCLPYLLRIYAVGLAIESGQEVVIQALEEIADFVQTTFTWDIYLSDGWRIERKEGPFVDLEQAIDRAYELWRTTKAFHLTVLIGSQDEQSYRASCVAPPLSEEE
jgi:hypothetical protein